MSSRPIRPFLFIGGSLVSGFSPDYQGLVLPHGTYQTFGAAVVRAFRKKDIDARLEMVAFPGKYFLLAVFFFSWRSKFHTGMRLLTTEHEEGMADVFFDGVNGAGGWEDRPKNDIPHDILICLGAYNYILLRRSCNICCRRRRPAMECRREGVCDWVCSILDTFTRQLSEWSQTYSCHCMLFTLWWNLLIHLHSLPLVDLPTPTTISNVSQHSNLRYRQWSRISQFHGRKRNRMALNCFTSLLRAG